MSALQTATHRPVPAAVEDGAAPELVLTMVLIRVGQPPAEIRLEPSALSAAEVRLIEQRALSLLRQRRGETPACPARLSEREVEVLRLIAGGRSNQKIADELVISLHTVARHVSNIFDKTGAANRAEAAVFAARNGLV